MSTIERINEWSNAEAAGLDAWDMIVRTFNNPIFCLTSNTHLHPDLANMLNISYKVIVV